MNENQLQKDSREGERTKSVETKRWEGENTRITDTHQLRVVIDEYLDVEKKLEETKRSKRLIVSKCKKSKKDKGTENNTKQKKSLRVQSELEPYVLGQTAENDVIKDKKTNEKKKKSSENVKKNYEIEVGGLFGLSHPLRSANPCALEVSKRKIPPLVAASFRERISLYLNSLQCPEEYRLSPHFEQNDLTPHKLRHIFNILDVYWYSGTLLSTIRKKEQVRLFWTYEPFAKGKKSFQPAAKTVALTEVKTKKLVELHWYFNKNRYAHSANCRTTNGIAAKHKLDALLITSLHEITHAIFYVWCPADNGHGEKFLTWNNNVHGSDEKQFGYQDSSVCPIPQKF